MFRRVWVEIAVVLLLAGCGVEDNTPPNPGATQRDPTPPSGPTPTPSPSPGVSSTDLQVFTQTVYAFSRTHCVACHATAGGIQQPGHAAPDPSTAYQEARLIVPNFNSVQTSLFYLRATSDLHCGPCGPGLAQSARTNLDAWAAEELTP